MPRPTTTTVAHYLTAALNAVVLAYLIVFSVAEPSPQLVCATIFEALFFAALLSYRYWQSKKPQSKELSDALNSIQNLSKNFAAPKRIWTYSVLVVSSLGLSLAAADLTALLAADSAHYEISRPIYLVMAPPVWTGLQPAFSMEILAGACVASSNFKKAESLEIENFAIRRNLVGDNHELIAASFCDLGDLYKHWNRISEAESYYQKAIALSTKINYSRGYGKPMTSLACLLRDQKRYPEAEVAFTKALAIRKKLFGSKSEKYGETLLEYSQLLQAEGRTEQANHAQTLAEAISSKSSMKNKSESMTPLLVSCAALALFTQKDKMIVFISKCLK